MSETLTKRIATILEKLQYGLEGLDKAIRLALLAALTGEHLLLYGPPGSGKTLVARRLRQAFSNALYFEPPLTQFTVPLIEYLSFLSQGRVNSPHWIVMFDKILEADWPIRGALLQLLRDSQNRQFEIEFEIPWMTVIGTSSTRPESEEHKALLDRFLLSYPMYPVRQDKVRSPLTLIDSDPSIPDELKFSSKDLEEIRKESATVTIPEWVLDWLSKLRRDTRFERLSDWRWRSIVKLLQTSAWTNGRREVSIADCWLLKYCITCIGAEATELDWFPCPEDIQRSSANDDLVSLFEKALEHHESIIKKIPADELLLDDDDETAYLDSSFFTRLEALKNADIRDVLSQIESSLSDTLVYFERLKAQRFQYDRDFPAQVWDESFAAFLSNWFDLRFESTKDEIQGLQAVRDGFNKLLAEQPS